MKLKGKDTSTTYDALHSSLELDVASPKTVSYLPSAKNFGVPPTRQSSRDDCLL